MRSPSVEAFPAVEWLGLYLPPLVLWGALALVAVFVLRWLFERAGLYRFVWHRALFNLALYVLIVGGLAYLGTHSWR